jgi:cation transport regulator ChaB
MPKTTKSGKAKQSEIPSTLRRSPEKAQRTFAKAHDSAADEYGDERRANQVAWAAVKHSYEKVGDHWEPKDEKGPHLMDVAKKLDISGRSRMKKDELVDAIEKANNRKTASARSK